MVVADLPPISTVAAVGIYNPFASLGVFLESSAAAERAAQEAARAVRRVGGEAGQCRRDGIDARGGRRRRGRVRQRRHRAAGRRAARREGQALMG